jgi:hypothetical protein
MSATNSEGLWSSRWLKAHIAVASAAASRIGHTA